MIKGSDVNRDYSMNSAIVRSFNRMVLTSAKT
jgi:flagellar basal-body rod protein FlgB